MPANYVVRWAAALLITLAVEVPLVAWAFRHQEPRLARRLGLATLASGLSHPVLFLGVPWLLPLKGWALAAGELSIVLFEAAVYRQGMGAPMIRALAVSLAANVASFTAGAIATRLLGWP